MAARTNEYAEENSDSTTTNTAYQDKTTLTFTPDDSSTYYIIASWNFSGDNNGYYCGTKLTRTTGSATDFNEILDELKEDSSPADVYPVGCVAVDTFGVSPGSQTYKIQYRTENSGNTVTIRDARVLAIKAHGDDESAESSARSTTSLTSFQDKTTLTFTPDVQGDYIIIASATIDYNNTGESNTVQLDIDGTPYAVCPFEPSDSSDKMAWVMMKVVNLTDAEHTLTIQYKAGNDSHIAGIAHARILALKKSAFDNAYYQAEEAESTTSETTYQTKLTLTETPLALGHLMIASALGDSGDDPRSNYYDFLKDASSYAETIFETKQVGNYTPMVFAIAKETLSAASTSWYLNYKHEDGLESAKIKEARVAVLQLDASPAVYMPGQGFANFQLPAVL